MKCSCSEGVQCLYHADQTRIGLDYVLNNKKLQKSQMCKM